MVKLKFMFMQMKTFNQEPYAIFSKKFSSFALYKGNRNRNFNPYQHSLGFCHREQDKDLIAGLRDWFVGLKFEEGMIQNSSKLSCIFMS